jgi:hypothetical protein
LAKGASGARDARHDGADGDVEYKGDVFVLDFFNIAEEESFAERRLEPFERCVEGGLVVEADEIFLRGGAGDGSVSVSGWSSRKTVRVAAIPTRVVRKVAEDAEDPGLEVGVGLEGVEASECLVEGLLHQIFGLGLIAGEPEGVVIERGEEWERESIKVCAAFGRRHGVERLGVSEVAG